MFFLILLKKNYKSKNYKHTVNVVYLRKNDSKNKTVKKTKKLQKHFFEKKKNYTKIHVKNVKKQENIFLWK